MPRYHVVAAAKGLSGGQSEVIASMRPGVNQHYASTKPVTAFDLPLNDLTMIPGLTYESYDQLLLQLSDTTEPWWLARIYENYNRNLDAYIKFSEDRGAVHHYEFMLPPMVVDPQTDNVADIYPQPNAWYYAISKTWIRRYTDADYDEYWGAGGTMDNTTGGAGTMDNSTGGSGTIDNTTGGAGYGTGEPMTDGR